MFQNIYNNQSITRSSFYYRKMITKGTTRAVEGTKHTMIVVTTTKDLPIIAASKTSHKNMIKYVKTFDNSRNNWTTIEGDLRTTTDATTAADREIHVKTSHDPMKKMIGNSFPSCPPSQNKVSQVYTASIANSQGHTHHNIQISRRENSWRSTQSQWRYNT